MNRRDDTATAPRRAQRLRAFLAGARDEGLAEYAVVLGVIAVGVAAVLVLMHSAGPSGVGAILRGTHP